MDSMKGLFGSLTKKVEIVGTDEEQASLLGAVPQFRNGAGVTFTRGGSAGSVRLSSSVMGAEMGAISTAATAIAKGYSDRPEPADPNADAGVDPESLLGKAKAAAAVVRSAGSAAADAAATASKGAKVAVGLEAAAPKSKFEEMTACCPALSYKTRVMGFMICYGMPPPSPPAHTHPPPLNQPPQYLAPSSHPYPFVRPGGGVGIGSFFWLLSTPAIPLIFIAPAKFAVPYTVGSLISMGSTMFMVGPTKQLQNMCKEDRRLTTTIYLSSMLGTLVFAMLGGIVGTVLCLVCISAQMASMVWYVARYAHTAPAPVSKAHCCLVAAGLFWAATSLAVKHL